MTTETSAWCVYVYTLNIYSVLAWANERCLSCVSWAMREPVSPGWAENSTYAFFVYQGEAKNKSNKSILGCCSQEYN